MVAPIQVLGADGSTGPAFHLRGSDVSYVLRVTDHGHVEHVHFGAVLADLTELADLQPLLRQHPAQNEGVNFPDDPSYWLDRQTLEWSGYGRGDYRLPPIEVRRHDGGLVTDFRYRSFALRDGTVACADGLPTAIGDAENASTLILTLVDADLMLELYYTVFVETNVIAKRVVLTNTATQAVRIPRLMSQQVDLIDRGYEVITLNGAWIAEAHPHRSPVAPGITLNSSTTGFSSNRHNPGVLLVAPDTGENHGEAYGFNLVYSGNHVTAIELTQRGLLRVQSGINPVGFEWTLHAGERFETPQAVLSFSAQGLNGLSANFHRFVEGHIVRGSWARRARPVLLNNWEATNFTFTHRKLVKMARQAKSLGVELFVLDDGWFAGRSDDHAGLGDYSVDTDKLPRGLSGLSDDVRALGLDFGLWVEPESVNPDSELYRVHPDWVLRTAEREPLLGRHQLILDLTRPEVRDYVVNQVGTVLDAADVSYVKWDANRTFADIASPTCPAGEVLHRYQLGLYEVLRRIFEPRPHILLESCASGGNRFDLGMLCFSPQIWASDCTDPIERLTIQGGLSYFYPPSTMGAHVTASPSEQTLRATPLSTRFNVAAFGVLGYELDPEELNTSERTEIRSQIAFYKQHRELCQFGALLRADQVQPDRVTLTRLDAAGEPALVGAFQTRAIAAQPPEQLEIPRLDPAARYRVTAVPHTLEIRGFGRLINRLSPVPIRDGGVVQSVVNRHYRMPAVVQEYRGSGAALSRLRLIPQFDGTGADANTRILGDFGSTLYLIEKLDSAPAITGGGDER